MSTTTATQLTAFEAKSVELFVDAAGVLGVPRSIAMIYGVLFGSAHALSFNDIVEKLGISKGSVSQGLRVLREMGAVLVDTRAESSHAGPGGGGAGSHYRPVIELRILLSRIIADKVQPHLKASAGAIDDLKGLLPEAEAESEVLDNRLRHLRSWQKRSQDLLPLLKAFLR